jgi:uncharacterized protein (DUF488 family)
MAREHSPSVVFTIGHSNRTLDEFIGVLHAHHVETVVDVRRMPGSRANPQFDQEALADELRRSGIGYLHLPGLGGLRRRQPGSPNGGWRNPSFQGYADYMQTPEFESALQEVIEAARQKRVALLCAEAVPWRCHRSLIADALVARGLAVSHILSATRCDPHALRAWAHVDGTKLTYPPTPGES